MSFEYVPSIEIVTRGYLAQNQLAVIMNTKAQYEGTVATTMSLERRKFSWLWDEGNDRALLVNRTTGALYDPATGQALNAAPRLLEAPVEVPPLIPAKRLPPGIFSTAQV